MTNDSATGTVLRLASDLQLLPLMSHQTVTPPRAGQSSGAVAVKHASCIAARTVTVSHEQFAQAGGSEETDIFNSNPIAACPLPLVRVAGNCQLSANCISVTVR